MTNREAMMIELGDLAPRVRERIDSGQYSSASEVIRAGLEALEREEAEFDRYLREKVEESLDDPRPDIPMEDVFERLERKYAELTAAAEREA